MFVCLVRSDRAGPGMAMYRARFQMEIHIHISCM